MNVLLALLIAASVALAILSAAGVLVLPLWAILLPAAVGGALVLLGLIAFFIVTVIGARAMR